MLRIIIVIIIILITIILMILQLLCSIGVPCVCILSAARLSIKPKKKVDIKVSKHGLDRNLLSMGQFCPLAVPGTIRVRPGNGVR